MNLNEKIMQRLLATFKVEANEHIQLITNDLIVYENERNDERKAELIEEIYRAAHSLKGAARAVGLNQIVGLCQNIENVFSGLKKHSLKESHTLFDIALKAINVVSLFVEEESTEKRLLMEEDIGKYTALLNDVLISHFKDADDKEDEPKEFKNEKTKKEEPPKAMQKDSGEFVAKQNDKYDANKSKSAKPAVPDFRSQKKIKIADQIRVSVKKIDEILSQSEEFLPNRQALAVQKNELASLLLLIETWKKKWSKSKLDFYKLFGGLSKSNLLQSDSEKSFKELLTFLEYNENFMEDIEDVLTEIETMTTNNYNDFSNKLYHLNEGIRSVMMLPFASLTNQFPLMVRDIAAQLGKEVEFKVRGDNIEIDKRVLDELKDPFIHLIRNCIDHGIETPVEREKNGKPPVGKITVEIKPVEGNNVEIKIADDGKGIDPEKLKRTAIERKIKTEKELESFTEEQILSLIFESELSTSKVITDLSGRGLGMAIVKDALERLSGNIRIESQINIGTSFTVSIPLSVATVRGVLTRCGGNRFYIKTSELISAVRVKKDEILAVEGKSAIKFEERFIGVVQLSAVLNLDAHIDSGHYIIVICRIDNSELGIIVDEIIHDEEILIKPFNKQIKRIKYYEAVTISADGAVIPVLNLKDIYDTVTKSDIKFVESVSKEETDEIKKILVVDDSITSRLLLKDILEASGYNVTTCVDGKEALAEFKTGNYNLVVTDIEMPRMNGFELTKEIKSDERYADVPIVLVTGLSSKEDMERGIDAGANAYIVKSDFEQSNLLETVERLMK